MSSILCAPLRRAASPSCRRFAATAGTNTGSGGRREGGGGGRGGGSSGRGRGGGSAASPPSRGRGRGSSGDAFRAYRDSKIGQPRSGKGEGASSFRAADGGGGGGKGDFKRGKGGKGRGGGKGRERGRGRAQQPSQRSVVAFGKSAAPTTFVQGQFDDVEVAPGVMIEQSINSIIDATSRAPNGVLVFDYEPTAKEKAAMIQNLPGNSSNRPIEELLAYGELSAALESDRASSAPDFVHEAWAVSAANPFITHDQRAEIVDHIDDAMRDIEARGGEGNLLDFVMTPPDV